MVFSKIMMSWLPPLQPIVCGSFSTVTPGVPLGSRKQVASRPRSVLVRAMRWTSSASPAQEIRCLRPLMTHWPPASSAVVEMSRPVPLPGSVRAKVKMPPCWWTGSHRFFCSSVPHCSTSRHMPFWPCTNIRNVPWIFAISCSTGK